MDQEFNVGNLTVVIKQGDITHETVDVIVNAANESLLGGGGVDGAIHRAGGPSILQACKQLREMQKEKGIFVGCKTGDAVITDAGKLPAKYVIHTVGPVWRGGSHREEDLLRQAYQNSLQLAEKHQAKSIAFPAISTGAYGFPINKSATVAFDAVKDFSTKCSSLKEIRFVLFFESDFDIYLNSIRKR